MGAKSGEWMERNHVAFHRQVNQTWDYIAPLSGVASKLAAFGYVDISLIYDWILSTFKPAVESFNVAFGKWKNPATRMAFHQTILQEAEAILRPLYRQLYGLFKGNPEVTDTDLIAMGMPRHPSGGRRSSATAPGTKPEAVTELTGESTVTIHFRDEGSNSKAKPHGVHGAEIVWEVLDTPPVDWSELRHSAFDTRTPFKFTFAGYDRGRRLYFALRWQNTTGLKATGAGFMTPLSPKTLKKGTCGQ